VVFDDALLPQGFLDLVRKIDTSAYRGEGTEHFLRDYGPPAYHSTAEYAQAVGTMLPAYIRGVMPPAPGRGQGQPTGAPAPAPELETDPQANARYLEPRERAVAAFDDALAAFNLDGLVYPAIQMPPNDELKDLEEGRQSGGPHSATAWVNPIGVPAVVVPGGFYDDGLPFGLEFSTGRWRDGDLLGWAFAYEQATKHRHAPTLVSGGQRR
jgi:Asp-tRNA(Asn)/Glu-tRNA(Gln) amidotransferase A subunit family amidase